MQHGVVVHLRLDRVHDLAQHELDAAHEQGVEDDHASTCRLVRVAMTAARSLGAIGFGTCIW